MNKNFTRKLGTMTLATVLAFGGIVGTVNAAETKEPIITGQPAVVTKNFSVHSKNTMPVETFEFELNPSKEGPEKEGMQAAPDSLVKLKENSLKFGDDKDDQKTIGLSIDAKEAGKPGIYRVKVQEKAGNRKGLTYDDAVRYIDFYVARNKNGELEVKHTVVYKEVKKGDNTEYVKQDGGKVVVNGDEVTSAVTFENMYFQEKDNTGEIKDKTPETKPDPTDPEKPEPYDPKNNNPENVPEEKIPDDENQEYNITVGKRISDDSVDRDETKDFEINVTIKGQEGDKFTLYKIDKDGNETTDPIKPIKLASGSTTTLELKHGEKYKIYGLTYDDTIKVEEVNADKFEKLGELEKPVAVGNLNENILVVNKSKTSTPTGLIQNMAPYAVVLSVALVGGTLYIKAKKEEELA